MAMNRREFLRQGAAAGAGLLALGAGAGRLFSAAKQSIGYKVRAAGGFIREKNAESLTLRALSLEPALKLKPDGTGPDTLKLRVENVWGQNLTLQGEAIKNQERHGTHIDAEIAVSPDKTVEISTKLNLPEQGGLHFAAMSDTHLGDPAADEHFSRVRRHLNYRAPLFTVDAGDVIDVDEPVQWEIATERFSHLEMPLFTTIGNHDSYLSNKGYRLDYGNLFYSFTVGDNQFLMLDNAQKYNTASLYMNNGKRDAQWDWLRAQSQKPAARRFAFLHFPVYGRRSMLDEMYLQRDTMEARQREVDEMIALFKESGVGHILHGHIHSPQREERDGIVHLRLGGGGGSRASHTNDKEVSFAHMFVDESGVRDYTVRMYFEPGDIEKIEFCEAPGEVATGAAHHFFVNGMGGDRFYGIEPDFAINSGPGAVTTNGVFTPKSPGPVQLTATYNNHKATHNFVVV